MHKLSSEEEGKGSAHLYRFLFLKMLLCTTSKNVASNITELKTYSLQVTTLILYIESVLCQVTEQSLYLTVAK